MTIVKRDPRTSQAAVWTIAALAAVLLAVSARGQIAMIPTPVIVAQSDLIVVVKIDKASDVAQQTLAIPQPNYFGRPAEQPKPTAGFFRTFNGTIEKIQRDVSGKAKVGDKIEVVAMAPKPVAPGGPMMVTTDGPSYPRLAPGQSYQLLLCSMEKGYYLPSYFKNFTPADKVKPGTGCEEIDVTQWPWGKSDADGLQLAVLIDPSPVVAGAWPAPKGAEKITMVSAMFALRNTSAKTLHVSADPVLRPVSVQLTTADGKPAGEPVNLYGGKGQLPPHAGEPIALAPGQVVFVSEAGPSTWFSRVATHLAPGKYKIAAE